MANKGAPEIFGAVACFAIAIGLAVLTAHYHEEGDASAKLVAVEADFTVDKVRHDVKKRDKDGTTKVVDETIVDAVYEVGGKTYRHSVSEEYALRVVPKLPGRGTILVDPRDPTRPPRVAPAGIAGAPLLGCLFSALLGVVFLVAAWRSRANEKLAARRGSA